MSLNIPTSYNVPLISIPLYYALAILPHGVALRIASGGNPANHNNLNPKSSTLHEALRKRLSSRAFAAWERAESCHRNHLENMPLFVAAVFAGLLAKQNGASEEELRLNNFVIGWMVIRALYTFNYLTHETQLWSYLRSVLYFAGTGWAFVSLGRSAYYLGN